MGETPPSSGNPSCGSRKAVSSALARNNAAQQNLSALREAAMKRGAWYLFALFVGAPLAACGGTETGGLAEVDLTAQIVDQEVVDGETAATVIEVGATEFAFAPMDLVLEPGSTVTVQLRNDGAVVHNFEMPELGVFVEAVPGVTQEVTFAVPTDPGEVSFWCNVAGHREFGMEGTVIIS